MGYVAIADVVLPTGEFTWPTDWTTTDKQNAINFASARIDEVTRQVWDARAMTIELSGDGDSLLEFRAVTTWPCVTLTSVKRRENYGDSWATAETLDTNDYVLSNSRRSIKLINMNSSRGGMYDSGIGPRWAVGTRNYQVIGTWGRSTTPEIIKRACVLLTREHAVPGSSSEFGTMLSESFADGYKYVTGGAGSTPPKRLTGYPAIDDLLSKCVDRMPLMAVP